MSAKETILVVDDARDSPKLLSDILSGAGYQVRQVDSGELALACAVSEPPDLIMLDVRMPDMDGIEVFRRLKAKPQTTDVPVILMRAAADIPEQVEGLELGAMDYIAKPFESRELLVRVQSRLELARLRRDVQQQAAQLKQSSEMLQNTLKSIGDAVISTDAQGRVLQLNPVAEQLTGWPESEACGMPLEQVFRIINEQTREPVENPVAKVFREKTVVGLANHTLLIAKDGRERPIADSGAPIRDKQGAIAGVVLVFRDQTAERAAEQALQKSEALFRSTIDDLRVGVVVHAADSSILISNPQASHILGPHKEQMLGKKAADPAWHFVHEDLSVMNVEDYPVSRVISTKKGIANQILGIKRADREEITWVSLSAVPVFSDKKVLRRIITNFLDITETKRAELALRESEETFRHVFEHSNVGKSITSPSGEMRVNQAFCKLLGYSRAELQHQSWQAISHPGDVELAQRTIDGLLSGKHDSARFTKRYIHKDGSVVWADVSTTVQRDSNGQPLYFITAVIDITARKQAEEMLVKTEAKQAKMVTNIGDVIVIIDREGINRYKSPNISKWFGWKPEEVVGCGALDNMHPDDADRAREFIVDLMSEPNRTGTIECRYRCKDGTYKWIEFTGNNLLHDSDVQGILGNYHDITERKRAEEALKTSEEMMRSSQAGAHICSYSTNLNVSDIEQSQWVCSPEFYKTFGIDETYPHTIAGWAGFIHPDFRDELVAYHESVVIEKKSFSKEYKIIRIDDGEERWVHGTGELEFDEEGNPIRMHGAIQDITERKQAEEEHEKLQAQLAQAQKLESVGRLAGGVAHDFNNMLMGVMNYAELCRDSIEPDHPIQEWLNEITVDAERSTKLTHQLLAFARKQVVAPKVIDINDAVGGMLKLLRRLIGEDITINWRPGLDVWPVKMDPVQIDQILANLAVNARDAIGGVGSIVIETGNVTFDAAYCSDHAEVLPDDYAVLTVTDSGCGMDEETRANIFEPFFTTKGQGEGTGLGLATVYGIVKQNNGVINVYSEPGQGTTFKIYLPRVAVAEAVQAASVSAAKPPRGTETVLLVEDEKSIRVTTQMFLENLGYTVLVAEDPKEALRLAADHSGEIHLLLTDVVMPGMSGRDLATRLSELRPAIKCIFISGFTRDVIAQRGILDDGVNFLPKPFGRDALAHKVREVLDG